MSHMNKIKISKIKEDIKNYIKLGKRLMDDKKAPKVSKILLGMAVAYFFIPIDIIPDFIPIIGHLDVAMIIPSLIFAAITFIPKETFSAHYKKVFKK